jgi:integrase
VTRASHDRGRVLQPQRLRKVAGGEERPTGAEHHRDEVDPAEHRFEATQALRQVLARAVSWGLIDSNPAKQAVDNPQRRRTEKRPFESWDELDALATELGPHYGPLVLFAAANGLRSGEWIALEHRDIDRDGRSSMSVARTGTAGSRF